MREIQQYQWSSSHPDHSRPLQMTEVGAIRGANFRPVRPPLRSLDPSTTDALPELVGQSSHTLLCGDYTVVDCVAEERMVLVVLVSVGGREVCDGLVEDGRLAEVGPDGHAVA
jgi:hypothetical protein